MRVSKARHTVVPESRVSDPGVAVTADDKPSIVFAHGLWADGSCFGRVISELQAEGYEAISSGYGLESLDGDVAATIRALGRVTSPSVLVGHSPCAGRRCAGGRGENHGLEDKAELVHRR